MKPGKILAYKIGEKIYAPEDVTVIREAREGVFDKYELAWLIWCWQQGYVKPEDREGLTNWMRESDENLTEKDAWDKNALVYMASTILEETGAPA